MSSLVVGGSLLASFLAGGLALLAPCCITFLLPAYFAAAFRQPAALVKMTFLFAVGIAVVLVPIALGVAALAQLFSRFHREINIIGGTVLMAVGVLALSGKGLMVPMGRGPDLKRQDATSVISLGVFSGVASSCCTPVLAGVLALSALSPSLFYGVAVSLAYVAGMVFPMLVLAYFGEERGWTNSQLLRGRRIRLRVGRYDVSVHSTNLAAGVIFLVMGLIVFVFGLLGGNIYAPQWQTQLGATIDRLIRDLLQRLPPAAEAVIGGALLLLVVLLLVKALRRPAPVEEPAGDAPSPERPQ